jgi:hypothetical protein
MPFCPSCRLEYRKGSMVCPDCNATLVEQLPEEKPAADISFVRLPDLPGRVYAQMVKGALEKRGIPCYIQTDGVGGAYRIDGTGVVGAGASLFVPEDRLEECLQIQHEMLDHI